MNANPVDYFAKLVDNHNVYNQVDCHENSKDNPALSEEAASRSIAEEAFSSNNQPVNNSNSTSHIRVESAEVERLLGGATGGSGIVTRGEDNVGTGNLDLIPRPQSRPNPLI